MKAILILLELNDLFTLSSIITSEYIFPISTASSVILHPKINIFFLPTVKELQLDDCLQIAMQSLVTEVSGCVSNPLEVHSFSAHTTVVPEVFS